MRTCSQCEYYSDSPVHEWIDVQQGTGIFRDEWTFCCWMCLCVFSEDRKPSFI